jgi:hypothetical protein
MKTFSRGSTTRLMLTLDCCKVVEASVTLAFCQTILLVTIDMQQHYTNQFRPSITQQSISLAAAAISTILPLGRLLIQDSQVHLGIVARYKYKRLFVLGVEVVITMIGMFTVLPWKWDDIWALGCQRLSHKTRPIIIISWNTVCAMKVCRGLRNSSTTRLTI